MSDWIDFDTEAGHLYEMYDGDDEDCYDSIDEKTYKRTIIEDSVKANEKHYKKNKAAKVGTMITCAGPLCEKRFQKKQYAQAFCCSHCKDQFWNRREAVLEYRKPIKI